MKRLNLIASLLGAAAIASLAGCGSDNRESGATASFAASQACIACHTSKLSPVTGNSITTEWQASAHNTRNGAACPDCHATNGHPTSGAVPTIPSSDTVCLSCHTSTSMKTYNAHFVGGATYDATKAAYVAPYDATTCRVCHNPHDTTTLLTVNKQWETSGHGDVTGDPWMHYKWRTASRNACQRCHTAGGFRYFMTTGVAPTSAIFGKYTTGREALGCKGCHTDYSWKRIAPTAAFATPYTPSQGAQTIFPDGNFAGDTQLCYPCHAGLSGGYGVETTAADLTNTNFGTFNSHYMAAAGTMYVKNGFTAFTSASAPVKVNGNSTATSASTNIPLFTSAGAFRTYTSLPKGYVYTYGNSLKSTSDGGAITSTHRILGTPAMANDSHVGGRDLVSGGPCVTCHMTGGHTLAVNGDAFTRVCSKCHTSEGTTTLTADNFMTVFVDEQALPFNAALNMAIDLLKTKYGIEYDAANYPYFWKAGTTHSGSANYFTDWTKGGTLTAAQAKKLVGTCFNVNLLNREPAVYVHARTYARRLLYDTLDFLDDKAMNMSVITNAVANYPSVYGSSLPADASTASENVKYLKAYNRTTNAWYPAERP